MLPEVPPPDRPVPAATADISPSADPAAVIVIAPFEPVVSAILVPANK